MGDIWGTKRLVMPSVEIEKEFSKIKEEMHKSTFDDQYIIDARKNIPESLFNELDDAYQKANAKYLKNNDSLNQLFLQYNYFWLKSFQKMQQQEPGDSLELLIHALTKLLERHQKKNLSDVTFRKMLKTFRVAVVKLKSLDPYADCKETEPAFNQFLRNFSVILLEITKAPNPIGEIANFYIKGFESVIDTISISVSDMSESENLIKRMVEFVSSVKCSFSDSARYESMIMTYQFRLKRRECNILLRTQYFEGDENKKTAIRAQVENRISQMIGLSVDALRLYRTFQKHLPPEIQNERSVLAMLAITQIDIWHAEYYREAYLNMDVFAAWKRLDKIREFLVMKVFREELDIGKITGGLKYFNDEFCWLSSFTKISLLRSEIIELASSMEQP